jgi:hypothetical protein
MVANQNDTVRLFEVWMPCHFCDPLVQGRIPSVIHARFDSSLVFMIHLSRVWLQLAWRLLEPLIETR